MSLSAWLLVLLANTAWAFNFIAGKVGVDHFPPLLFTSLRFCLLLLILLPFLRIVPGAMPAVLRLAVVLGVVHFALMFLGLAHAEDISPLAIASQLYVPFSVLLAVFMLGERLGTRRCLGIATAFAGVMLIGLEPVVVSYLAALGFVIAAALAMAVATVMMRQLPEVGVFTLQAWIAAVAAPSHLLLSLLFEHGQAEALATAGWLEYGAPLYSAVGASILGHGVVYYLLRRYPVSLITPLLLLTPLLAVVFGVWLLDDTLTGRILAGGALTLFGVAVISTEGRRIGFRPRAATVGEFPAAAGVREKDSAASAAKPEPPPSC